MSKCYHRFVESIGTRHKDGSWTSEIQCHECGKILSKPEESPIIKAQNREIGKAIEKGIYGCFDKMAKNDIILKQIKAEVTVSDFWEMDWSSALAMLSRIRKLVIKGE